MQSWQRTKDIIILELINILVFLGPRNSWAHRCTLLDWCYCVLKIEVALLDWGR